MSQLKKFFDQTLMQAGPELMEMPWESKEFYSMWLSQTYHYVNHSTRLILMAGAHFDHSKDAFHRRFIDYCREERNHEKLAVNDIKGLGLSLADLPELTSTKCFYQSQYYWIQNKSAVSFFGYILALEGIAVTYGSKFFERAIAAHGPKAVSFLKVHVNEDVEHVAMAFEHLKDINQTELIQIQENMVQSMETYKTMLVNCAHFQKKKMGKAS